MKALAIILAPLLVVGSVDAQQMVPQRAPNFYVPYSVTTALARENISDSPPASEGESSSADPGVEGPPLPEPPQPQCRPLRRGVYSRHGAPYGTYPAQGFSDAGAVVLSIIVIGLLVAAVHPSD